MKQLETIQKETRLNDVFAIDGIEPGGVHHLYSVCPCGQVYIDPFDGCLSTAPGYNGKNPFGVEIHFQEGPRNEPDSVHGVSDCDLLEIVRDRLTDFQNGPWRCADTAAALLGVEHALYALKRRSESRASRGVLGRKLL